MGWENRPDCEECGGMWELYEITNRKRCKCDSRASDTDLSSVRSNDRLALLVDNAIRVAKFHKDKCDEDCDCSMFLLGQLCIVAGAELTDEQISIFM